MWKIVMLLCFSIALHFPLSTFHVSSAQCGVKVKPADKAAYTQAIAEKNHKKSAQMMRRVAQRNPKAADPQFQLGMMSVRDGFNVTGIRRYFSRCIELCPNYPNALAHVYMDVIHYTDARYDDAVAELEQYFALANNTTDRAVSAAYEEASNYLYWSQFLAEATLNMAPFEPERVQGVSSKHNEMLPYLTVDGREMYYLRELPVEQERTFYARELEQKQWRLCRSLWQDTVFSRGTELPAPFNSGRPEGAVSLTADGNELYFSIITDSRGYANSDIYRVRRSDGRWQQPENLGPQVNGDRSWESQPSVSADGQWLFFASNRKGGQGGIDIWRCHRLKNGDWSRPENLGANVNTAGNDKTPFIAADGRTLYFLSDGWQGFGGYDIYFTDLADTYGNRPTNLGLPINTETDEVSFGVSADGRRAYFSGRLEGARSADILMFDLYPAARPEPMALCRLEVRSPSGCRDTLLILPEKNKSTVVIDAVGQLPFICCGRARDFASRRSISLNDTLMPLPVAYLPGSRLDVDGEAVADALAQWLVAHPMVHIDIECPRSTYARAVVDRLRRQGIRPDRLGFRGGTDIQHPQMRLVPSQSSTVSSH